MDVILFFIGKKEGYFRGRFWFGGLVFGFVWGSVVVVIVVGFRVWVVSGKVVVITVY